MCLGFRIESGLLAYMLRIQELKGFGGYRLRYRRCGLLTGGYFGSEG